MFKIAKSKKSKAKRFLVVIRAVVLFLFPYASQAQCAMCRASLETEGSQAKSEAINNGIVFLMAIPYVLIAVVGFAVYRMYSSRKKP